MPFAYLCWCSCKEGLERFENLLRDYTSALILEEDEVLYCREKVQPLLQSLCRGVSEQEVPAALQGLLANSGHTRFAALSALHLLPCLSTGTIVKCPLCPEQIILHTMASSRLQAMADTI